MSRVAVVGGGPAGMMCAAEAAKNGHSVTLYERNEKLGKKLFITGKGRCNLTNSADIKDFFENIPRNPRFLYSALYGFTNEELISIINKEGVRTKVERGGRVFPESDKSSDILRAMADYVKKAGVDIRLNSRITSIKMSGGKFELCCGHDSELYDSVALATGGASYPSTGSTGDGYAFAKSFGHTVTSILPSLISLETEEDWPKELMGLSLKNITLTAYNKRKKQVYSELGEMLFTHFGVSGPLVLSASSRIADDPAGAKLVLDLKPALSMEELDKRLVRDFQQNSRKSFCNALDGLFPKKLIPVMVRISGIAANTQTNSVTREQRCDFAYLIKNLTMHVKAAMPIDQAIITRGGINVKEINPSTMESKLVRGLYFAGEVMDVDAYTGGFNIQIACSTGVLAGRSIE